MAAATICVSQACGSTLIIFAVCKSVATVAKVPAASGSYEQCIPPSNRLRSDGALDNVGIDFDTPIAQEHLRAARLEMA
jgi:hypothetical protein